MADYRKIDIRPYNYDSGQCVKLYLVRYVRAVDAILPDGATAAQKKAAYLINLPPKLDDFTLQIFESSANNTNWDSIKTELIDKLTDPAKAIQFQNKLDSIKWDGEIPLKVYENRIIEAIRTLDPDVLESDTLFERECFKRFVAGLPPTYRAYVEARMPVRSQEISKARECAEKFQEICSKSDTNNPLASWCATGLIPPPNTGASFGAYKTNSFESLGEQISMLSLAQKENIETQKETNKNINSLIDQLTLANTRNASQSNYRPNYGPPSNYRPPSPGRNNWQSSNRPNSPYRGQQYQGNNYQPNSGPNQQYYSNNRPPSPGRQPNQYYNGNRLVLTSSVSFILAHILSKSKVFIG